MELSFRKKGYQCQFRFNKEMHGHLISAQARLDETASTLNSQATSLALLQATSAIEEGSRLMKARQKAIRLADRSESGWFSDRSESGWFVVMEYDTDKLAEDSPRKKLKRWIKLRRGRLLFSINREEDPLSALYGERRWKLLVFKVVD